MEIDFRVFGNLRDILGYKQKTLQMEQECTIGSVLDSIKSNDPNGNLFYFQIFDTETKSLKKSIKIAINENVIPLNEVLTTKIVEDGAVLAIYTRF